MRRKWKLMVILTLFIALTPFLSLSWISYYSIRKAEQSEAVDQTLRMVESLQRVVTFLLSEDEESLEMIPDSDDIEKSFGSKKVFQLLSQIALGKGENIFIADTNDILKSRSGYYEKIQEKIILSLPANDDESRAFRIESNAGEPLIVGLMKIPKTSLLLIVIQDENELIAGWRISWIKLAAFFGTGILIIFVMVLATATYVVNQIHEADQQRILLLHQMEYDNRMAALGRLSAGVAHEINNPISIINEKVGLIKDILKYRYDKYPLEKLIKLLEDIDDPIKRCAHVTQRLLNFGRHIETPLEQVDLGKTIYEMIDLLKKEADFRGISISTELPENLPKIKSNKGNLEQIFLNLMNNAFAAMNTGGRLSVKVVNTSQSHLTITFTDNGCGISKKDIRYVFEPFYSTKGKGSGTGLGLSVTYGLVQELGGEITVDSTLGEGTRLVVTLPFEPPEREDGAACLVSDIE